MIVVGKVLDQIGGVARSRAVVDRAAIPGWRVATTYSHEPLALRSRQPRDLPVNVAHDRSRTIGTVRHLEVGADGGDAWAVCDVRELPDEEQLFFSLEGQRGGHDGAILSALAVTPRPAGVGLSPIIVSPVMFARSPRPRR